jgi:hypothetical protein
MTARQNGQDVLMQVLALVDKVRADLKTQGGIVEHVQDDLGQLKSSYDTMDANMGALRDLLEQSHIGINESIFELQEKVAAIEKRLPPPQP